MLFKYTSDRGEVFSKRLQFRKGSRSTDEEPHLTKKKILLVQRTAPKPETHSSEGHIPTARTALSTLPLSLLTHHASPVSNSLTMFPVDAGPSHFE